MTATDGSTWTPRSSGTEGASPSDGTPQPEDAPGASWADVDLAAIVPSVLDGTYTRTAPTILPVPGTQYGLFYAGKVNGVHGFGGSGKTWIVGMALVAEMRAGNHVMFVDFEDDAATLTERLVLDLGLDSDTLVRLMHYKRPVENSALGVAELRADVDAYGITLVVLDSTGESLSADGVKQNDDGEVAAWMASVARRTADRGAAVVLVDHVPKTDEKALMPTGSQRKLAAVNGAQYSVQVVKEFARDKSGYSHIVCGKDRHGKFSRGQRVAALICTVTDGVARMTLGLSSSPVVDTDGPFRPTHLMQAVSEFLTEHPGSTGNAIKKGVPWRAESVGVALDILVAEEYVKAAQRVTQAGTMSQAIYHENLKPYREKDDAGSESKGGAKHV